MATIAQAIRLALHEGETRLGVTDIFGEDVGPPLGGVFTCTQGLKNAWNSPLDERGIIGTAMGLAMAGEKPVAEIQFVDYIFNTIDLLKLVGNSCWSSNGQFNLPLVLMTPVGSGIHGSLYHSHSFDTFATHMPGWKVVLPSNPVDTYGLLISAINDPNPVMFLYPKVLIRQHGHERIPGEPEDMRALAKMIDAPLGDRKEWKPKWPNLDPNFSVPIGPAKLVHRGNDMTVVSYGRMLPLCEHAANRIQEEHGFEVDVIDLRTLFPYDLESIKESVKRTGRLLVVNEDTEVANFGEHLIRRMVDDCFYHFEAPPRLLAGKNLPGIGIAWELEEVSVPQSPDIEKEMLDLLRLEP